MVLLVGTGIAHTPTLANASRIAHRANANASCAGMVIGVRPDTYSENGPALDGMPTVPGVLPGQDIEGGSECDFDVSADGSQVCGP